MANPPIPSIQSPIDTKGDRASVPWFTYWQWLGTAITGGTVTSVTATSPIVSSGGTTPNITHATSGVVAGTYGDATHVPQVTVNATGHVTAVTDIAISTGDVSQFGSVTAGHVALWHAANEIEDGGTPSAVVSGAGYWSPLMTGGGATSEMILTASGDAIMVWTPL